MAFFQMNYFSDALGMSVSVNVVLPEKAQKLIGMRADGPDQYKTLYLYHGLSDDHTIWQRRTSIERYAADYGIAVFMPNVGRSWYTDTSYGGAYFTFVSEELPRVCRRFFKGMSDRREDNLVAGLSMGGYGAVKVAFSCPERFGYCASFSGAFDIASRSKTAIADEWRPIFGMELTDPDQLNGTKHDVYALARKNSEQGKPFPKLYMWCGLQDDLLDCNRRFSTLLDELNVEHCYVETDGNHSWGYWDTQIQCALKYWLG